MRILIMWNGKMILLNFFQHSVVDNLGCWKNDSPQFSQHSVVHNLGC